MITNNQGSGIVIGAGASSASARAVVEGVRTTRNANGIRATGVLGTGPAIVHVRNSVATQNFVDGIRADIAGSAVISVTVDRTSSTLNGGNGVAATGANTFVLLGRSTAISNTTGLAPTGGGNIFSYKNNHLTGNGADGAPTGVLALK
jgi:hypothetical protein